MLVLTRRTGQQIQIGPDIWVEVLDVRGQYVSLGITAPPETPILRQELVPGEAVVIEPDPLPLPPPMNLTGWPGVPVDDLQEQHDSCLYE